MRTTWTTKDGKVLEISEMETSHIEACIELLKRTMPGNEKDETICADFPESMDYQPCCYTLTGAESYRKKIAQFEEEFKKRI